MHKILVPDAVVDAIREQFEPPTATANSGGRVEPMVRQTRFEQRASEPMHYHHHHSHEQQDADQEAEKNSSVDCLVTGASYSARASMLRSDKGNVTKPAS